MRLTLETLAQARKLHKKQQEDFLNRILNNEIWDSYQEKIKKELSRRAKKSGEMIANLEKLSDDLRKKGVPFKERAERIKKRKELINSLIKENNARVKGKIIQPEFWLESGDIGEIQEKGLEMFVRVHLERLIYIA